MFEKIITPRFCETDALGHISNTTLPIWFEDARQPVFALFTPTMDIQHWPLILARFEVDFLAQIFFGQDVTLKTSLSKLGNTSIEVYQEAWQNDQLAAVGKTVLVNFDYATQKKCPIEGELRRALMEHLQTQ